MTAKEIETGTGENTRKVKKKGQTYERRTENAPKDIRVRAQHSYKPVIFT
jgi:hypothetical protein